MSACEHETNTHMTSFAFVNMPAKYVYVPANPQLVLTSGLFTFYPHLSGLDFDIPRFLLFHLKLLGLSSYLFKGMVIPMLSAYILPKFGP